MVKNAGADTGFGAIEDQIWIDVNDGRPLFGLAKTWTQNNKPYHHDWCFVEHLGSHFVDHFAIAGNADICDQSLKSSVQSRPSLGFGGRDSCVDTTSTLITYISAQGSQSLLVLDVDR